MFSNVASVIGYVRQGKVRAIAASGAERSSVAPDVPTVSESGVPGFIVTGFFILLAPAGTPPDVIALLNAASVKALQTGGTKERLATLGLDPVGHTSADCGKFIQAEIAKWAPVVRAAGMHTD
jgi:tripartite-type tricarboxylate transporter receptor subunit TctC